jgi:hypothetical protein
MQCSIELQQSQTPQWPTGPETSMLAQSSGLWPSHAGGAWPVHARCAVTSLERSQHAARRRVIGDEVFGSSTLMALATSH